MFMFPQSFGTAPPRNSAGAVYKEHRVDDDGLDRIYNFTYHGQTRYLLGNNLPREDRYQINALISRKMKNATIGIELSIFATVVGLSLLSKKGFKFPFMFKLMGCTGSWLIFNGIWQYGQNKYWAPVFSAFFRKYLYLSKDNILELQDESREFFYIDDSTYMNYTKEDVVKEGYPDYNVSNIVEEHYKNNEWIEALDEFAKTGDDTRMKKHYFYENLDNFTFIEKPAPTVDNAIKMFTNDEVFKFELPVVQNESEEKDK